jgi:formylmethanofuran dehydrogenase subunit B
VASTVKNAVCQGCGCLCDDIEIEVADGALGRIDLACDLGRNWYASRTKVHAAIDEEFIRSATEKLKTARLPIILGIELLTSEIQRLVVRLAERIGGIIASESCSAIAARQEAGEVTATLGEIKSRADLIVFWFADPMRSHPRFLELYSSGAGRFVDRRSIVVVVDDDRNCTSEVADEIVPCVASEEFDVIQQLRSLSAPSPLETSVGEVWKSLAQKMKAAKYGALVFDPAVGSSQRCEALFKLVRDLNRHTCFVAATLGKGGNNKGAENVLQWTTGFPANVSFATGDASYNGDENSAEWLLRRGRVDLALLIGDWNPSGLSLESANRLAELPTIRLQLASVLETVGTVFRMDGVPLPTTTIPPSVEPTAASELNSIIHAVGH